MHSQAYPPEFTNGVSLPSQLDLEIPCLCFLCVGIMGGSLHPPSIYMGPEDANFSLHVCIANTLTTELSPAPMIDVEVHHIYL